MIIDFIFKEMELKDELHPVFADTPSCSDGEKIYFMAIGQFFILLVLR